MGVDSPLFIFALVDEGYLLFLVVYFVITLSDLECDYLNARSCCEKLNFLSEEPNSVLSHSVRYGRYGSPDCSVYTILEDRVCWTGVLQHRCSSWILPEMIPQAVLTVFLLLTGHWILFPLYGSLTAWLIYRYVMKPSGNIGIYDPTEIHNRQQLKSHMKENLIKMGFHLLFFFVFLYLMIYSLIKSDGS